MDINQTSLGNGPTFHHNALVLATYVSLGKWYHYGTELVEHFWEKLLWIHMLIAEFIYKLNWLVFQHFSAALEAFDIKLTTTSPMHAFVKTGLQDRSSDCFSDHSPAEIVSAETLSLKSSGHASKVCSLLTAYCLLDVMYALEHPGDAIKAPEHHHLQVNFASFKVTISFFCLWCHDTHLDIYLDFQATHRLDVSCQELSEAILQPTDYEWSTHYFLGSWLSWTLHPVQSKQ